jgi:O-antigen ligase
VVKTRIDTIGQNIEAYHGGNTGTSVGLRLEFYKNSSYLISQHPIFGTGTGSFSTVYKQLADKTGIHPTTNPHNEFLMLGVQLGIFGIGLFAYLLWQLWQLSFRLTSTHKWMAQGVVVMMFVGCLVNSLLLDFTEGHVFAYLVGWLYANLSQATLSPVA